MRAPFATGAEHPAGFGRTSVLGDRPRAKLAVRRGPHSRPTRGGPGAVDAPMDAGSIWQRDVRTRAKRPSRAFRERTADSRSLDSMTYLAEYPLNLPIAWAKSTVPSPMARCSSFSPMLSWMCTLAIRSPKTSIIASICPAVWACPMSKHTDRSVPLMISASSEALVPSMTGSFGMFSMHTVTPNSHPARSKTRMVSFAAAMLRSLVSGTDKDVIPGCTVSVSTPMSLAASISDMNSRTAASRMRRLSAAPSVSAIEACMENVMPAWAATPANPGASPCTAWSASEKISQCLNSFETFGRISSNGTEQNPGQETPMTFTPSPPPRRRWPGPPGR